MWLRTVSPRFRRNPEGVTARTFGDFFFLSLSTPQFPVDFSFPLSWMRVKMDFSTGPSEGDAGAGLHLGDAPGELLV